MRSDSLALFGVTGNLVHKMIFPALYAMAQRAAQTGFWPQRKSRYRSRTTDTRNVIPPDNYDGTGPSASAHNSVYFALWGDTQ